MMGFEPLVLCAASLVGADGVEVRSVPTELRKQSDEAVLRAVDYLSGVRNEDGGFGEGEYSVPMTGLVVNGLIRSGGLEPDAPVVADAIGYLRGFVRDDGGIYVEGGRRNYPTAIAILAFVAANRDGRFDEIISDAVAYLKKEQWDEGEGITPENPKYGGLGYGRKSRPDLSNTAFTLEAWKAAGLPEDDPGFRQALLFVRRCQNFAGEGGNDLAHAEMVDDGGFYYTPAEDYNPGGGTMEAGLRSYGSMTYAGLKSFIYAGLDQDDPRVQAALGWIKKNYTLEENPGLGQMGLYYYYHTFAKALDALGSESFEDADGVEHEWRSQLLTELLERQRPDGSWYNEEKRWLESDPVLVTAYCLMAIGEALR